MSFKLQWFSSAAMLVISVVPLRAQNGGAPPARTVRDSVFSAAQAQRGADVFAGICSPCHSVGQFVGKAGFIRNWHGRTFLDVFQQISSTMPNDNPGGLSRREYVDVMTYLLHEAGYPTGKTDLAPGESALKGVLIVPLEGGGVAIVSGHPPGLRKAR